MSEGIDIPRCPKCNRYLKPSKTISLVECRYCNIKINSKTLKEFKIGKQDENLSCIGCKYKKQDYPNYGKCRECIRNRDRIYHDYYKRILKFRINQFLTLKLEDKQTNIYINNILFQKCKYLLLNIPTDKIHEYDQINSIDEVSKSYDHSHENNSERIPPKTEFLGHCSNLQAWYEHNYDTKILHRDIAFPLLKKLTDVGDPLAKKVFKEEIALRISEGYLPVIHYLIEENYFKYFTKEELDTILESINNRILRFFIKLKTIHNHPGISLKKLEFTKPFTTYRVKELTKKKEKKYKKQELYKVIDVLDSSELFLIKDECYLDFNIKPETKKIIILQYNSLKYAHKVLDNDQNNYLYISREKNIPEDFIVLNFEKKIALYFHGYMTNESIVLNILKKRKKLLQQAQERWEKYGFTIPNRNKSNQTMKIPHADEGMKVV